MNEVDPGGRSQTAGQVYIPVSERPGDKKRGKANRNAGSLSGYSSNSATQSDDLFVNSENIHLLLSLLILANGMTLSQHRRYFFFFIFCDDY